MIALYEQSRLSHSWSILISLIISIVVTPVLTKSLTSFYDISKNYLTNAYSNYTDVQIVILNFLIWYFATSICVFLTLILSKRIVKKFESEKAVVDKYNLSNLSSSLGSWASEGRLQNVIEDKLPWCESLFVVKFGSSVKGNQRGSSDIDYCFFLNGESPKGFEHYALSKYKGRKPFFDIDFIEYATAIRELALGSPFYHSIAHGKLVLGKENLFESFRFVAKRVSIPKKSLLDYLHEQEENNKLVLYECREDEHPWLISRKAYSYICSITQYHIVKDSNELAFGHLSLVDLANTDVLAENISNHEDLMTIFKRLVSNYKTEDDKLELYEIKRMVSSLIKEL